MFSVSEHAFHPFTVVELANAEKTFVLRVVPDHGATLQSAILYGQELLETNADGIALDINRWARGNFLFPFPNRLRDGQYAWNGTTHQFPINDPMTGNALHGMLARVPYRVSDVFTAPDEARLELTYTSQQAREHYPFPFSIAHTFRIHRSEGVEVETRVSNPGAEAIPLGWGWHPYFTVGGQCDGWTIQVPACQLVGIDQRMLPTGKRYAFDSYSKPTLLKADVLDNCFFLNGAEKPGEISLRGPNGTLEYWQETGEGKYPFVQLFTHPERQSLAIEPMTCNVDALNSGEGLHVLNPGAEVSARFGFRFLPG